MIVFATNERHDRDAFENWRIFFVVWAFVWGFSSLWHEVTAGLLVWRLKWMGRNGMDERGVLLLAKQYAAFCRLVFFLLFPFFFFLVSVPNPFRLFKNWAGIGRGEEFGMTWHGNLHCIALRCISRIVVVCGFFGFANESLLCIVCKNKGFLHRLSVFEINFLLPMD